MTEEIQQPKKLRPLNMRQKLFADWYIKLMHVTNAAINAGYSKKTAYSIGSENLTKPEIQAYIAQRKTQLEDLLQFNKATIIQDLHTIKEKSSKAIPVMYYNPKSRAYEQKQEEDDEGNMQGVYQYDSQGAIRAIENINKMMGYNEPEKVEDMTPLEKKPSVVIINKTYANKEPDQPAD